MSAQRPRTLEEWTAYLGTLTEEELWDKAVAANRAPFVQTLLAEGYTTEEVTGVFTAVARRFRELGQRAPDEGWYDLNALGR